MFKLLFTAFLTFPLQRLYVNNDIADYFAQLTPLLLLIPTFSRHNEPCKTDDDCPMVMRCCELGNNKYCCTPNNFVKMNLAYQNQEIPKKNIEKINKISKK